MRKVVEIPELSMRQDVATYHVVSGIRSDGLMYLRRAVSLGTDACTSAMPGSAWLACAGGGVVVDHLKAGLPDSGGQCSMSRRLIPLPRKGFNAVQISRANDQERR